jgi:hypothetical protein
MNETPVAVVPSRGPCWVGPAIAVSLTLNLVTLIAVLLLLAGRPHPFCHGPMGHEGKGGSGDRWEQRSERFDRSDRAEGPGEEPEGTDPESLVEEQTPASIADHLLVHLDLRLALTEDQKKQIRPILQQETEAVRKTFEQSRQATQAKVRAVLTPEQQKQFEEMTDKPGERPEKR